MWIHPQRYWLYWSDGLRVRLDKRRQEDSGLLCRLHRKHASTRMSVSQLVWRSTRLLCFTLLRWSLCFNGVELLTGRINYNISLNFLLSFLQNWSTSYTSRRSLRLDAIHDAIWYLQNLPDTDGQPSIIRGTQWERRCAEKHDDWNHWRNESSSGIQFYTSSHHRWVLRSTTKMVPDND